MKHKFLFFTCMIMSGFMTGQDVVTDITNLMQQYEKLEMINGVVLVSEGDQILYKKAFGKAHFEYDIPNQVQSKFEVASISKQFTAILILQLIEEGKLTLHTKVTEIISEYPKDPGDKINIGHLLTHTSGLIDTRHIQDFDRTHGMNPVSREKLLAVFQEHPLLFEPGTKWSYSNFGYNLLAILLERVSGLSIHELVRKKIFDPSGMQNSTTLENPTVIPFLSSRYEINYFTGITPGLFHHPGWSIGSGNIVTTAEDYFKYYRSFLDGKILSREGMDELTRPRYFQDFESGDTLKVCLSYFWDQLEHEGKTIEFPYASGNHYGVHAAAYHFYKEEKLIVIFINLKMQPTRMFQIGDNIARILYGYSVTPPKDMYVRHFAADITSTGISEAVRRYKELKRNTGDAMTQQPRDFNRLGYYYLGLGKPEIAVEIFKVNLEVFPDNPDLMDSLGEGYMNLGQYELAILYFQQAADRDPSNMHAREMLEELSKKG